MHGTGNRIEGAHTLEVSERVVGNEHAFLTNDRQHEEGAGGFLACMHACRALTFEVGEGVVGNERARGLGQDGMAAGVIHAAAERLEAGTAAGWVGRPTAQPHLVAPWLWPLLHEELQPSIVFSITLLYTPNKAVLYKVHGIQEKKY